MQVVDAQFVIYVKNLERSRQFYESLFQTTARNINDKFVEISIGENLTLGLITEAEIVKVLGTKVPHPMIANGIPRSEIYVYVENPSKCFEVAVGLGAEAISESSVRPWGHEVAYVTDFDGVVIAFAKNT